MRSNHLLHQTAALALLALPLLGLSQDLDAQRRGRGLAGWIQEDISRGLETARTTGKPLLVVFRCPP